MKKSVEETGKEVVNCRCIVNGRSRVKTIILTILAVIVIGLFLLPLSLGLLKIAPSGNIAIIPLEGVITSNGESYLGSSTISSSVIVDFIKQADENEQIKVILLEINSPGGTPVATDEIATAVKKAKKPVVAVIREVGASGGYWVASAADYVLANKMSVVGSIGVVSSYLEFSGLMEKYGVGYEQLIAGEYKDMGVPYRQLTAIEKAKIQSQLDKLHSFFISEVAQNRQLSEEKVKKLATGEVFLGIEAVELGLVDQIGTLDDAEEYIKQTYQLEEVETVTYAREAGFLEMLSSFSSSFSFGIGQGLGATLFQANSKTMI